MDKTRLSVPGYNKQNQREKREGPSVSFEIPRRPHPSNASNESSPQMTFPMKGSPQIIALKGERHKIRLKPHHSALDWENYKHTNNMKDIDPSSFPIRISKSELAKHNQIGDCWIALGGKVYNISKYLDFHPGGAAILLKHAGHECTSIFMKYHRWVNYERILDECFIGFLI